MLNKHLIQPCTITVFCLANLPDFAYPYQGLARGVLFRASPEEVRTVVHDAVVVICEVGVGRLRSPLVEVAPFAWNAIEIPVSLFRPCVRVWLCIRVSHLFFAANIKAVCTRTELNSRARGLLKIQEPSPPISPGSFREAGGRERAQLSARDGVIVARKHSFVAPNCERTERGARASVHSLLKLPRMLRWRVALKTEPPSLALSPSLVLRAAPVHWRSFICQGAKLGDLKSSISVNMQKQLGRVTLLCYTKPL